MESVQPEPSVVRHTGVTTAVIKGNVPVGEIHSFFDSAFGRLPEFLEAQGVLIAGPAFARYFSAPGETFDLEVGFPTDRKIASADGIEASSLPDADVARLVHEGGFDGLGESWIRLANWIVAQGLEEGTSSWEVYLNEPTPEMDPAELRVELNWPLA